MCELCVQEVFEKEQDSSPCQTEEAATTEEGVRNNARTQRHAIAEHRPSDGCQREHIEKRVPNLISCIRQAGRLE